MMTHSSGSSLIDLRWVVEGGIGKVYVRNGGEGCMLWDNRERWFLRWVCDDGCCGKWLGGCGSKGKWVMVVCRK